MKDLLRYVSYVFKIYKKDYPNLDDSILKSCLAYKFLYHKHFEGYITIDDIIKSHADIGLIGPGSGCLSNFLEHTLGWIDVLQTHAILHDAYGRFYNDYSLGRGYSYAYPDCLATKNSKSSPLCGQMSGILYCIFNRIII